jgi:hypothetical protein
MGASPLMFLGYKPAQMALASGTHVGPYEIIYAIGAGSMGEVCRAREVSPASAAVEERHV